MLARCLLSRTSWRPLRALRCLSSGASPELPVLAPLPVTTLTGDEAALRDVVSRFAAERVAPRVRAMDAAGRIDSDIVKGLFETGLMGVEIPTEHGGSGASFLAACVAVEELARVDASVSVMMDVHNTLVNNLVLTYASQAIKARLLPRLASDTVGCFCLSEPTSGSDAFALKTTAERKGDYFVLNGAKSWITNGGEAGVFFIMANIDTSKGHRGITCFVVEGRDTPGLGFGKCEDKLGIRASSTVPLTFDNIKVPASSVVGELGQGYKIAIGMLNEGRVGIAAQMLGIAQGAYDATMPYLFQRKQFGQHIGDFQAMQHQYAQAAVDIECVRLLTYNAARRKMAGLPFVKEAAMAKLKASQVAESVSSQCIEWMGGVGLTKDMPQEKFFRDCKVGAVYEGTSNVQRNTIAKLIAAEYK